MVPTDYEIVRLTRAALRSLWGSAVVPSGPVPQSAMEDRLNCVARVNGRLRGIVVVTCSLRLARQLARIYSDESVSISSDHAAQEAVRETARRIATALTEEFEPSKLVAVSPAVIGEHSTSLSERPVEVFDLGGEPCSVLLDVTARTLRPTVHWPTTERPVVGERSRRFERVPVKLSATVSCQNQSVPLTQVRDLSMAGMYVASETHLPRGTDCDVVVHEDGNTDVLLYGRVARNTTTGFAVEFLGVDKESCGRLRDWIGHASTVSQATHHLMGGV